MFGKKMLLKYTPDDKNHFSKNFKFQIFHLRSVVSYTERFHQCSSLHSMVQLFKGQVNRYPVDKCQEKVPRYLMDRDLSSG